VLIVGERSQEVSGKDADVGRLPSVNENPSDALGISSRRLADHNGIVHLSGRRLLQFEEEHIDRLDHRPSMPAGVVTTHSIKSAR